MKYAIEITDDGCVETLEFPNGEKFTRRSKRTNFGCQSIDDDFQNRWSEADIRKMFWMSFTICLMDSIAWIF